MYENIGMKKAPLPFIQVMELFMCKKLLNIFTFRTCVGNKL